MFFCRSLLTFRGSELLRRSGLQSMQTASYCYKNNHLNCLLSKKNPSLIFRRNFVDSTIADVTVGAQAGGAAPKLSLAGGFITAILSYLGWEDLLAKEDPFILTIKRGILCMQREEFDKAEIIFHAALTTAVTTGNEKAIIYLYALLGNNAFLKGEYEKSEKIYKDVIVKLINQGIEETHESIIEISLKIATIFSKQGAFDKADIGFSHCLQIQKARADRINMEEPLDPVLDKDEINTLALYGMALDWYGKHLLRKKQYDEALKYTKSALELCEKISGKNSHQTMVLLSDVGALLNLTNYFDEANSYFEQALKVATALDSEHIKTIYYNMGMNNMMRRQWLSARQNCDASYKYAEKDADNIIMKMAQECLKKAKAMQL